MSRNIDGFTYEPQYISINDHKGPLRKETAVGTGGVVGASFAIIEKNWICEDCGGENFARQVKCMRCKAPKPTDGGGLVESKGLLADMKGDQPWREAMDPTTQMIYYYNTSTGESSWERPEAMGPAPLATGFWGRGSASLSLKYMDLNKKYLERPARKQVDHIESKFSKMEGANDFNLWYGKYQGDSFRGAKGKDERAETRCNVASDAGYTKCDKTQAGIGYFCIHFARGACANGADCKYYHRIPTPVDEAGLDSMKDIFGRDRHTSHRDDMSGAGSFQMNTRTLYIGGVKRSEGQDLPKIVEKHFEEWGEVEQVNVIYRLSVAFVRYRLRTNAEFAREAMGHQSLENKEILNVRWAYDDPNPVAKEAATRANQDAIIAALQSRGMLDHKRGSSEISDGEEGGGPNKKAKSIGPAPDEAFDEDVYINAGAALEREIASKTFTQKEAVSAGVLQASKDFSALKSRESKLDSLLDKIGGVIDK